ncbi:AAA family ATPase [Parafrankia sp. FMc2]|uniref:AAA family ATPase n=1 Tax=Parafrankia sp. FMc2 TaxID=3233196 RepID=UPI0034D4A4B1
MVATPAGAPVPGVRVRLLGEFEMGVAGAPAMELESARAASLLAFLLLNREAPQSRQRIAFLLWPDSTEAQARTNLRHVLHKVRRAFGDLDHYVEVTPRTLRWRPGAPLWLDVAAFEDALSRAAATVADATTGDAVTADGATAALREATELYRADLLEGNYDDWLEVERQRLRSRFLDASRRLANRLEARGDPAAAAAAELVVRHDPLYEPAYQILMRHHEASGDRARALRAYHACAAVLEAELGTRPSASIRRQFEALLAADRGPRSAALAAAPGLVGRNRERSALTAAWQAAAGGEARLVLVTGEPGIGKTRLVAEFRAWCAHRGALTAEAAAYAAEGALAYGLIVSWLRSDTLGRRLRRAAPDQLTELARLLPELLTELPGLPRPQALAEDELRQRLFDTVARTVLAAGAPVLLVADDVHWSDQESLRFLHYLLRPGTEARLLVAATARPEELTDRHPLAGLVGALRAAGLVVELDLDRLDAGQTAALARQLTSTALDDATCRRLFDETEGNPLFVVEALRAGWDRPGAAGLSRKVQAVIESRLAQLSPAAAELVGVAATIGRDFTADMLAEAAGTDADALVSGLDELWQRRIVREHEADGYDFSHDKLRAVAYEALQPARRRHYHRQVARALERRSSGHAGTVDARLALHLERAGDVDGALVWYGRAAAAAGQLYAHVEALRLLDRALDLVPSLPWSTERDVRELALLEAIAAHLVGVESFASPRLPAVHERALVLAATLGADLPSPLLCSLAVASLARGEFATARRLGAELLGRGSPGAGAAELDDILDDIVVVEAEYVLGIVEFWQGNFEAARLRFEAALARYRPADQKVYLVRYWLDPKVVCLSRLASCWDVLGQPAAAARARQAALLWAEEVGHPATAASAQVFAAVGCLELGDVEGLRHHTTALVAAHDPHDAPSAAGIMAQALQGYVNVLDGEVSGGLAAIRRLLDQLSSVAPAPGARAVVLRVLLAAAVAAQDTGTGLAAADRLVAAEDGVATWESEARRWRAEFLGRRGEPAGVVVAELQRAREVARRQGAQLFEQRATAALRLAMTPPAAAAAAPASAASSGAASDD